MSHGTRAALHLPGAIFFFLALTLQPSFAEARPVTMWELQGKSNRIFLLGSIHLLRSSDYPIPGIIYRAYDEADALIMELDMDDQDPLQTQAMVQELGMFHDGGSLQLALGKKTYAEAERLAAELQIPLASLAQLEPWLAAVTVETIMIMRMGFELSFGIESHLMARASSDGKEITGLETERQQFGMLDSLSPAAQRDMLLQALSEGTELGENLDALVEAWRHGDVATLAESLLEEMAESKELYETIVADRNRDWIKQIEALLDDEDDYLIIVGTLHLVGPDGVPELLKKRGHTVRQMQQLENNPG